MFLRFGSCALSIGFSWPPLISACDRVAGRHEHVVALGAGGELGQQLLVVRVVGLHDLALAGLLEALDRLRRDVVVPVVEVELVLGGGAAGEGEEQRGEQQHEACSWSLLVAIEEGSARACEAMTISANVSSISSVDTALTSGVTAILIIE